MRTTIIILTLFLVSLNSKAQLPVPMPVFDVANATSLASQLAETGKVIHQVQERLRFLREQKENIERVSNAIRTVNQIARLLERQAAIGNMLTNDVRRLMGNQHITVREGIYLHDKVNRLYDITREDVRLMRNILQDNFLKMNDAKRFKRLRLAEQEANERLREIQFDVSKFDTAIAMRELQQNVNQLNN